MVAIDKIETPLGQKSTAINAILNSKSVLNCGNCLAVNCGDKCGELVVVPLEENRKEVHNDNAKNPTKAATHSRKCNFIVQYFKKKSQTWNRNQFVTISVLSFVEFFAAAVISIQAPFYPDVASKKGAEAYEYGIVFGIFELVVFLSSPVYGAKMDVLGPRRVFNWGILTTGICCVVFGLLDSIEGRAPFIWSCLVVRIVEALGDAAFDTASFTIIAMEFPDSVATSFSILEIWFGLGLIIGPTLGGALYEIGGYRLPFLTMGGCLFLSAIATYLFLPEPRLRKKQPLQKPLNSSSGTLSSEVSEPKSEHVTPRGGYQMFKMLKIPVIMMTAYSIVAATAGVGFLSANLDQHLKPFELNKFAVGAVFVTNGGVYAITAPAWGWICDHTDYQKVITFTGTIFTISGFVLIGPVPFFPFETSILMSCIGLSLFGFGLAATLVSAFLQILNDAIAFGYPDDISTYGLVSGLWTSMSALGYCIGPSIGGVSVHLSDFKWSSLLIIGGQLILLVMLTGYYFTRGGHIVPRTQLSRSVADVESTDAYGSKITDFEKPFSTAVP